MLNLFSKFLRKIADAISPAATKGTGNFRIVGGPRIKDMRVYSPDGYDISKYITDIKVSTPDLGGLVCVATLRLVELDIQAEKIT